MTGALGFSYRRFVKLGPSRTLDLTIDIYDNAYVDMLMPPRIDDELEKRGS